MREDLANAVPRHLDSANSFRLPGIEKPMTMERHRPGLSREPTSGHVPHDDTSYQSTHRPYSYPASEVGDSTAFAAVGSPGIFLDAAATEPDRVERQSRFDTGSSLDYPLQSFCHHLVQNNVCGCAQRPSTWQVSGQAGQDMA